MTEEDPWTYLVNMNVVEVVQFGKGTVGQAGFVMVEREPVSALRIYVGLVWCALGVIRPWVATKEAKHSAKSTLLG